MKISKKKRGGIKNEEGFTQGTPRGKADENARFRELLRKEVRPQRTRKDAKQRPAGGTPNARRKNADGSLKKEYGRKEGSRRSFEELTEHSKGTVPFAERRLC